MFNIKHGNDKEALELIDKVYDKSEDREQILNALKQQCEIKSPASTQESFWEQLFDAKYRKASLVAFLYTFLIQ